ncbi:MAG: DNA-processing protein DprA [Pseudomonadota bacterium]
MTEGLHPSTHPPLPPTTEDDRLLWLRLLRSRRVGPATFYRLMAEHGSAGSALDALPHVARAAGVRGYTPCTPEAAEAELHAGAAAGATLLAIGEPGYPASLSGIADAPPLLWIVGDETALARPMVALVGARNASSLGLRMARALASELTEQGVVVVSGLARGIDAAAHRAALPGGTIAVMAGGIDVLYPFENAQLGRDILKTGLRLSEMAPGVAPQARHFPARNRIISGLASAVVVVEAAGKSGSLLTARTALDQGREVLVVPGHPFDARAAGCNMLIRDGATLVRHAEDVLEALPKHMNAPAPGLDMPVISRSSGAGTAPVGNSVPMRHAPASPNAPPAQQPLRETAALHSEILNRLGPSPLAEDQLIRDLAAPAASVSPALTDLELDGQVQRHPGGMISRS